MCRKSSLNKNEIQIPTNTMLLIATKHEITKNNRQRVESGLESEN